MVRYEAWLCRFSRGSSNNRSWFWAARFSTTGATVRLSVVSGARGARNKGAGGAGGAGGMTDGVASSALSNLGADLSVSVSFVVANEFLAAANEAQMGDEELVALLITVVVVVTSAKRLVDRSSKMLTERSSGEEQSRGLLEFISLLLSITQRISLSISVQVLAVSMKANQPSRLIRVITLLGVVVFFVFFESAATRHVKS